MENATEVRFQCPSCDGKMAVEPGKRDRACTTWGKSFLQFSQP